MATYKVPQDVEAEDKLIGPLSFRQFIYAMIAGLGIVVAFFLFQISTFLVVIPAPVIILFGILALPLRKDQPMEIYLLAILRFILRPHKRLWVPDGILRTVEIAAPVRDTTPATHSLTSETAEKRLEYLTEIMDSRGWSFKHADRTAAAGITPTVLEEASSAPDVLDDHAELARSFDMLLSKKSEERRKETLESMRQAAKDPSPTIQPERSYPKPQHKTIEPVEHSFDTEPRLRYNPYPTIHQKVVQPYGEAAKKPSNTTKKEEPKQSMTASVSPGIMRLAHNDDLSISAIAREANRLADSGEGEVVISLHPSDNTEADR